MIFCSGPALLAEEGEVSTYWSFYDLSTIDMSGYYEFIFAEDNGSSGLASQFSHKAKGEGLCLAKVYRYFIYSCRVPLRR